jgi:AraC family transcriptional regulator, positive regulator of tynA and feaB
MQTLYAYSGRDVAELRRGLAVMVHDEFTDGELEVAPRREVRSVHRTGLSGPVTFMHSLNGTDISFRRSWHHIRARTAAVRLLYFVLQGEIQVVSAAGSYTVPPGRCAVINADEPFYTRCSVPEGGSFESALAVVPEHLVLSRMPWAKNLTTCFEVDAGHRQVVTSLLELLCFEGDRLSRRAADPRTEAFLESLSEGVGDKIAGALRSCSLVDRRFADIRECIQKYVTCPDLSSEWVAQYCGISPRYLCYVLKANDTCFSELLWSERLPRARDWLVCEAFRQYPIHKIACMAGFKSAAHFSRMFKSAYGMSPKDYRASPRDCRIEGPMVA